MLPALPVLPVLPVLDVPHRRAMRPWVVQDVEGSLSLRHPGNRPFEAADPTTRPVPPRSTCQWKAPDELPGPPPAVITSAGPAPLTTDERPVPRVYPECSHREQAVRDDLDPAED